MTSFRVFISLVLMLALAGCGGSKFEGLDTRALEKSFGSAEPEIKGIVDQAIKSMKAKDYDGAMMYLTKVPQNDKLTADQQKALKDAMVEVGKLQARVTPMFPTAPPPSPATPAH